MSVNHNEKEESSSSSVATLSPWVLHFVRKYEMKPHVEGGFYSEIFRHPLTTSVVLKEKVEKEPPLVSSSGGTIQNASEDRHLSTSIFYLLAANDFSCFHKIKAFEQWHYYCGNSSLIIHVLDGRSDEKKYGKFILNNDCSNQPQTNLETSVRHLNMEGNLLTPAYGHCKNDVKEIMNSKYDTFVDISCIVPPDCWFAAELLNKEEDRFVMSGCTCSFGFDFKDFETGKREQLLREFCGNDVATDDENKRELTALITRLTRE
nr:unnamed protein product [Naegleria fowleri]